MKSHFEILGLAETCTKEEAKTAFLEQKRILQAQLAAKEPEVRRQALQRLQELSAAYKELLAELPEQSAASAAGHTQPALPKQPPQAGLKTVKPERSPRASKSAQGNKRSLASAEYTGTANRNMLLIGGSLLVVLMLLGALYYIFTGTDFGRAVESKTGLTNSQVQVQDKAPQDKEFRDKALQDKELQASRRMEPRAAYITGDDVILRAEPSTVGGIVKVLPKTTEVTVLSLQNCDDPQAAMVTADKVFVKHNGSQIKLSKGQLLKVLSQNNDILKCQLELQQGTGVIYIDQKFIRKLYGDTWYQVRLTDGSEGWVYKDYIALK